MKLPSSERLRKPLIIMLIVLLLLTVIYLALFLFTSNILAEPMDEETKEEVYKQSKSLVNDILNKESKNTYEQYMSSPVKKQDESGIWWENTVNSIRENELTGVTPYIEQEEFYKAKKISKGSPQIIRYGIDLEIQLDVAGKIRTTTAKLEWIQEEGKLKLYLLKMPYKFIPVIGPVRTVYGVDD